MIKRGAKAIFVHFYSYPYTDKASLEKVIELAQILAVPNYRSTVYLVPFAELQQIIVAATPSPLPGSTVSADDDTHCAARCNYGECGSTRHR